MNVSRREFIQTTAATSFALSLPGGAALFAQGSSDKDWFDRPMRWAQLNLVESDPAKMDRAFWLDYFKRIHADAACLSAGGVVAFYPTKVPFHHRSQWLPGNESFYADMVDNCRKQGMVVVARTDPHATYQDVADAHPDWLAVDAAGKHRPHPDYPGMWLTCALGPYNFDFMTDVTREIVTLYDVGGVFSNRWTGSGICYCEHCKANFFAAYKQDLPRGPRDPHNPLYRNYLLWHQARLFELWDLWDKTIQAARPTARYIANSGGGATSGLDMIEVGKRAPTLFADRQVRERNMAPWANGKNGKEYRATLGNKAIGGIFNAGIVSPYRWLNSGKSAAETRVWVQDGMANGLRPWFNMVSGQPKDKRVLKVIEDLYVWHAQNEKYLRNTAPVARIAMVYSQQTAEYWAGSSAARTVEDPSLGIYQALIDARLPFEMVHDHNLDAASLAPFKLLILPNIAALSDKQCEQLKSFVQNGGGLVATWETSLYDEWGTKRPDFGLADLFKASYAGTPKGVQQNTYLHVEDPAHPILRGLEGTENIIGGTNQITIKPHADAAKSPLTRIPAVANLPMEKTFWTIDRTDEPEVMLNQIGAGRVVYFPWDIDRLYWDVMAHDHSLLLRNAITWALNEPAPITVTGPGMFDVTVWQQKSAQHESLTVHLVNLTNPMAMRPNMHELIPSHPQHVELEIPKGKRPTAVHTLMKPGPIPHQQTGNILRFTVPSILDYEVIAIDLA